MHCVLVPRPEDTSFQMFSKYKPLLLHRFNFHDMHTWEWKITYAKDRVDSEHEAFRTLIIGSAILTRKTAGIRAKFRVSKLPRGTAEVWRLTQILMLFVRMFVFDQV